MNFVIVLRQLCLLYDGDNDGFPDWLRVKDVHSCVHGLLLVLFSMEVCHADYNRLL